MKKMFTQSSTSANINRRTTQFLMLTLFSILGTVGIHAQVTGTKNVPGDYATLAIAIDSLNATGVSGAVIINVNATQNAPAPGYQLGSVLLNDSLNGSTTNSLTFDGGGDTIMGYTGTKASTTTFQSTTQNPNNDCIWAIRGVDNVTIDDFVFQDLAASTTNNTAMEHAVGLFNLNPTGNRDGCHNILIENCTINFNGALASYGIIAVPTLFNSTANLTWVNDDDKHIGIEVSNNTFNKCYGPAFFKGVDESLDVRRVVFKDNVATEMCGGLTGSTECFGVGGYYLDTFEISGNTLTMDNDGSMNTTASAINPEFGGGEIKVNDNVITIDRNGAGGSRLGFNSRWSTRSSTSILSDIDVIFRNNEIKMGANASVAQTNFAENYGIYAHFDAEKANTVKITVDSNTIFKGDSIKGRSTFYALRVETDVTAKSEVFINNNDISNVLRASYGGNNYGIYCVDIDKVNINDNDIGIDMRSSTASSSSYTHYSIRTSNVDTADIYNNTISSYHDNANTSTSISNSSHWIYGVYNGGSSRKIDIHDNVISKLHRSTLGSGLIKVAAIRHDGTCKDVNIYRNCIDSIIACGESGYSYGIFSEEPSSSSIDVYNNHITGIESPELNNSYKLGGIHFENNITSNIYNNTIYLGSDGVITSSDTNFGGHGVMVDGGTTIMKNNIINVNGTPKGTGSFVAFRGSETNGTTGAKPANITASNNIYHVNDNVNNAIYIEGATNTGTNAYYTTASGLGTPDPNFNTGCGLYNTFMGEISTFTEDNLGGTGSKAGTHVPTGGSFAESSSDNYAEASPDLNNVVRGTTHDRGALEFTATATDASGPVISYTQVPDIFCTTAPSLEVDITDASGVDDSTDSKPRLYYKKTTENNAFSTTNNTATFNGWKYVEPTGSTSPYTFNFDYAILNSAIAIGDQIEYFVVAQDSVNAPNVSINSASLLPSGTCPTSVALTALGGATGQDTFEISNPPNITSLFQPTVSCVGDTITHEIVISLTSPIPTTYCGVTNNNNTGAEEIDSVSFIDIQNQTGCPPTLTGSQGTATGVVDVYSDFVGSTVPIPDVYAGKTYDLTVKISDCQSNIWSGRTNAFIDWNRDGDFIDADETYNVYLETGNAGVSSTTNTIAIDVPTNIPNGRTKMRIKYRNSGVVMTECSLAAWSDGEVEDYELNLIGKPDPALTTYSWTSDQTGATVLGTENELKHATLSDTTIYTNTLTISGCTLTVNDTVHANPIPGELVVTNSTQCGALVSTASVNDTNGFISPNFHWYADDTASVALQSSMDTTFTSPVAATDTFYVSVENPATGCQSPRVPVIITVLQADSILGLANGTRDTVMVCSGSPVDLTASNVQMPTQLNSYDTFTWVSSDVALGFSSDVSTTGSFTFTPMIGGGYDVTVTALDTGGLSPCAYSSTVHVMVQQNPFQAPNIAKLSVAPNPLCIGETAVHSLIISDPNAPMPTGYCVSNATNNLRNDIDSVSFAVIQNGSGCVGALTGTQGVATGTAGQYSNWTNSAVPIPDVKIGETYDFYLKTVECSNWGWNVTAEVYFDWNRDGDFNDADEVHEVLSFPSVNGNISHDATISVTVPSNITSGPTLMRIVAEETNNYNLVDACGTYFRGETEDYKINLVGAPGPGTTYSWTSDSTTGVLGTDSVLTHALVASKDKYQVVMTNGECVDSLVDSLNNNVPAFTLNSLNGPFSSCYQDQVQLVANVSGGCKTYMYTWTETSGNGGSFIGSTTGDTVVFGPTGTTGIRNIKLVVEDGKGAKDSLTHFLNFNNPMPTVNTNPDTICGPQTTTLNVTKANPSDSIYWYPNSTTFASIGTGASFSTPILSNDTVFYIREVSVQSDTSFPKSLAPNPTVNGQGVNNYDDEGHRLRALNDIVLETVDVYPAATGASVASPVKGDIEIAIFDEYGVELMTTGVISIDVKNPMPPNAWSSSATFVETTVPLGFKLAKDNTYDIVVKNTAGTTIEFLDNEFWGAATTPLPDTSSNGNLVIVAGKTPFGTSNTQSYNFWNYKIEAGCFGEPVADTVVYLDPPALTISMDLDTICSQTESDTVTITSTLTDYSSYVWSPTTNITGDSANGYVFDNAAVGTHMYQLIASQNSGNFCFNRDTFQLNVKSIPATIVRTPLVASTDICIGSNVPMTAESIEQNDGKIGTGTTGTTTDGAGPWSNEFEHTSQHIYTASELNTAGIKAGPIDSIGFFLMNNSIGTGATGKASFNLSIGIGHVAPTKTDFSDDAFVPAADISTVYTNATHTNPGAVTSTTQIVFPFSSSFDWDGTSDIVVQLCQDDTVDVGGSARWEFTTGSGNRTRYTNSWNTATSTVLCSYTLQSGPFTSSFIRPNVHVYQNIKSPITYSPITGLYHDEGVSSAYVADSSVDSVWAAPLDTTKYYITATHENGCAISDSITINVMDTVTYTMHPDSFSTYCVGDTMKLFVSATSTSPITSITWRKNGIAYPAKVVSSTTVNDTLEIVTTGLADSGLYDVIMQTGAPCANRTSKIATVKMREPVVITTQPNAQTICVNSPLQLIASADHDSAVSWIQMPSTIKGAMDTLDIASAQYTDSGDYYMVFHSYSPCPTVHSDTVHVSIWPPATIDESPEALTTLCIGQTTTLKAMHSNALGFQWLKDGSPITGAVTDSLVVTANTQADSGTYQLVVMSPTGCDNDTSSVDSGVIKVNLPVVINTHPPMNQQVCLNDSTGIKVSASNFSGFQWLKDGAPIAGETDSILSFASAQLTDDADYSVIVLPLTSCMSDTSTVDTLKVTPLAMLTTVPVADTVCFGQQLQFTAAATDVDSFQWFFNGNLISGSATGTHTIASAAYTDSGLYHVVAISADGCLNDTSSQVIGHVNHPVNITMNPPMNQQVCLNNATTLSATAEHTSGYQWLKDGAPIAGADSNVYVIDPATLADAGVYTLEIKPLESCSLDTTTADTLKVTPLAMLTMSPMATTVCEGQAMSFTASATDMDSFQWLFNGTPKAGANMAAYNVASATLADSGQYSVVAVSADGCLNDTSAQVLGQVNHEIDIITQPISSGIGCIGAPFEISAVANNTTGYQWYKDGATIAGETNDTIMFTPFTATDPGTYVLEITGMAPCPNKTTTAAVITSTTEAVITQDPVATDVCLNDTLVLTTVATAAESYQWYKNGVAIPGAVKDTFTVTSAQYSDAANYHVIAKAFFGCKDDTSATVAVIVSTPISITTQPNPLQTLCENNSVSLSTSVTGTSPYTYQWFHNGNPVGTNANTYNDASLALTDSGDYTVNITGSTACPTVTSSVARINVNPPPVITAQPNGASPVCIGSLMSLNASVDNVTGIQWFKSGVGQVATDTDTYAKTAQATDAGDYYVVGTALEGCVDVTSNTLSITVNTPVSIAAHPVGAELLENPAGSHTMSVVASGTGPFTYKWYKDGVAIPNSNSPAYTITNYVAAIDSGLYCCEVSSGAPCNNVVTSNCAYITTTRCPIVQTQPIASVDVCEGMPISLDVEASGAYSYQWYKDNVAIEGANYPNYSIAISENMQSGTYKVQVINFPGTTCEKVFSNDVTVNVSKNPTIAVQPNSNGLCGSSTHTMSVVANDASNYQWFKDGIAIPGANTSTHTEANVSTTMSTYYVEVSNAVCPSVKSNEVQLQLVDPATQVQLTPVSVFDLVEKCTDNNGWTYYATSAASDSLLIAIKKNGNMTSAKPDIELLGGIRDLSPLNIEERGGILGSRLFNLDFSNTITEPFDVKFFYSQAEEDLVVDRFNAIKASSGSAFTSDREDITFITSTQVPFNTSLWNSISMPLNLDYTIAQAGKYFGTENGVKYVVIEKLVTKNCGGTLFMDYYVDLSGAGSGIANAEGNIGVKIFPVPTYDGQVTVEVTSNSVKPLSFTVTDMTGRVVATFSDVKHQKESKHKFDFSDLANGNYQLRIENESESTTTKFTISR